MMTKVIFDKVVCISNVTSVSQILEFSKCKEIKHSRMSASESNRLLFLTATIHVFTSPLCYLSIIRLDHIHNVQALCQPCICGEVQTFHYTHRVWKETKHKGLVLTILLADGVIIT
jgi:hypothetical protein